MIVQAFPSGPFETNAYVVGDPATRRCAIVDPAPDSAEDLFRWIEESRLQVEKILLTHTHWDHIADAKKVRTHYGCPLLVHPLDMENLRHPGSDQIPCWIKIEGVDPDQTFEEGDHIPIGKLVFDVMHTPGHTPGGVCFYCKEEQVLLSGDTFFKGAIGNISFATGEPEKMWKSLERLAKMPGETKVYPGHGPSTTIAEESWLPMAKQVFGQ